MPITVPVRGDTLAESNEKFSVRVANPTNATVAAAPGEITITDDDPPDISIAAAASITEGNVGSDNVAVVVTLSQTHFESVFVNYATSPGTALAGSDYLHTTGTLQFYPGTATKTIYVPVVYDTVGETTETFYVDLSAPINGTLTAATRATVSIVNDDNSSQVFTTAADFGAGTLVRVPISRRPAAARSCSRRRRGPSSPAPRCRTAGRSARRRAGWRSWPAASWSPTARRCSRRR